MLAGMALLPVAQASETIGSVPTIRARDLKGKRFDLKETLKSGPAIVTFWATWCKPCLKELPELQKLREEFKDQGLSIVAINGDGPVDAAKIKPFVRAKKYDFKVILDGDGNLRRRLQVEVFPTTYLVDADGEIRHRQVGYRQGDEKILREAVTALLAETTP